MNILHQKTRTMRCSSLWLAVFFLSLAACFCSVDGTKNACDINLANITCVQMCNGNGTCNSTCPTQRGYRDCIQRCSSPTGCPSNLQCRVPSSCVQDCYDGQCYCNSRNCTQKCSASYCKNTDMMCISKYCDQTCSGDCGMQCASNATGRCQQRCTGNCKNITCDHKSCMQTTNCRNPPCTLHCSSNVDDCRQTCAYGLCKFSCNAKKCRTKCTSVNCVYEGGPREKNIKTECDVVDKLTGQCHQEGCGWPNCSMTCANEAMSCVQNCLDPSSPCPTAMTCSNTDCMQNCFGKCPIVNCKRSSKSCSQLVDGSCDIMRCNASANCLQHCAGKCQTLECFSDVCLQSCASENCTMACSNDVKNCSQTCSTKEAGDACMMTSKASNVEHQTCNKNCISMTCGDNSKNCTQTCSAGCKRMVCSSTRCDQECTNGDCELECTSAVKYCKQTCKTGNCTVKCLAQHCEQDCDGPGCPPRPTTSAPSLAPTTFNTTTRPGSSTTLPTEKTSTRETESTTQPTEPATIACQGETSGQRKIEALIHNRDDNLVVLLSIALSLLAFLVLAMLVGFAFVLKRLRELLRVKEFQLQDVAKMEGQDDSIHGFENTRF